MDIESELSAMSIYHCAAFAAACCERMIDSYDAFSRAEEWGKPELLRTTLDEVWATLGQNSFLTMRTDSLIKTLRKDGVVPDPGDFRSVFSDSAGDAANGVLRLVHYVNKPDVKHIVFISKFSIQNVVVYLERVCAPLGRASTEQNVQEWLEQAPLKLMELEKQRQDLALLGSLPDLTEEFVKQLRWSSRNMGIQPLSRGLLKQKNKSS